MEKAFKSLLCFLMLAILQVPVANAAPAQPKVTITGVVIDAMSNPVTGAFVVEKGTTNGAIATEDGSFTLTVPSDATIEVTCIGYASKSMPAAAKMKFVLEEDSLFLEETVVVGYGAQRVATVTGSVAQVKGDKLVVAPATNTTHTLAGQLPGLITKQTSGLPGQDDASLSIRGFGTPLVIIDGIEGDIANIDPGQIESVSILKDGSGSIYGARAGNGVILVTTKTGSVQKPTVTINASVTLQSNIVTTKPASSYQRAQYENDCALNGGASASSLKYNAEELELFKLGTNPEYRNVDWYGAVVRQFSPQQNHNISVSGGTERTKYYGYFGWNRSELQFKSNSGHYDKYNVQANFSTKVTERFTIGANLQFMSDDKLYPSGGDLYQDGTNFWQGIIYSADPRYPLYLPDETKLSYANMQNGSPLWAVNIDNSGYYQAKNNNIKASGFAEYAFKCVDGLKAKANIIYTHGGYYLKWMHKRGTFYTYDRGTDTYTFARNSVEPSSLREDYSYSNTLVQQYSLNYDHNFGKHHVGALAMFESTMNRNSGFYTKVQDFQTTIIEEMVAGDATTASNNSWSTNYGRTSVIVRANYSYDDKYIVEAIVRGDASSRFAQGYKWGWFPSVSLGWNMAREEFLRSTVVDNLKIRASYGTSGYDGVADFNYLTGYSYDLPYTFGSTTYMGLAASGLANEKLSWERMAIANAGVDFSLFGHKLYGELDVFQRDRTGIPGYRSSSLPDTFGATLPQENLNAIRNRGFEFKLGTSGSAGEFVYDINANISYSRAKWTKYDQTAETDPDRARLYTYTGTYTDRQLGYLSDGIFESQEAIDNWGVTVDEMNNDNSKLAPGDVRLVDVNEDGVINWKDQVEIGKGSTPHWMTGWNFNFAYKGFDLSFLLQGAWGYTLNVQYDSNTAKYCELYYDQYHNANPNAIVARPNGATVNWFASDFMYRDVAYLRMKNASFGYSLPAKTIKKIGLEKCRFYLAGMNLFTISSVSQYGVDPEAGSTVGYAYPQQFTLSLGLNIVF